MNTTSPLPHGHVTILFTDVEESSRMNKALGNDLYAKELREPHFVRLRQCIAAHNGHVVGTPAGDSLMVVFQEPNDALACAKSMQESLVSPSPSYTHAGMTHTVQVRIGVHTAQMQIHPKHADDYSGDDANFAARVESLGAGGQIIVHESVKNDAGAWNRYNWQDWPNRRLKSFDSPEVVYELLWDGEARKRENKDPSRGEPGARWLPDWYRGERNRYIAREDKEKEILAHFATKFNDGSPVRLVTLKGFGGMGKTRLGLTCGLQCAGLFAGKVYFVRLEDQAKSAEAVAEAIGAALGLEGEARLPANLTTALREADVLLMLDNYESVHCPDVQRFLRDLLHQTRRLRLLVTGREAVKIANVEQPVDIEGLTDKEARQLFIARAQLVQRDWQPTTPQEEHALADVLRLTERIPLALELVAAGMGDDNDGSVELVAQTLEATPLPSLPIGYIPADPSLRQESLTRCLDWSYNLLDKDVQQGFIRLGLFADTFTPATAEGAAGANKAVTLLQRLAQASLIKRIGERTERRFAFLRPTRAYAHDKLAALPDADALHSAYVAHFRTLVTENGGVDGSNINDADKRGVLDAEWRNIVGGIEDAQRLQEWRAVQDMTANLINFFDLRGLWSERVQTGLRALAAARASKDRLNEGVALNNLGSVYECQGRWEEAVACLIQSFSIYSEFGDRKGEGHTLNNLGNVYRSQGRWQEAVACLNQSLVIRREFGDHRGEGSTLNNLGNVYRDQRRWQEANVCFEQDLAICRKFGDRIGEGSTLNNLGNVYRDQRRWQEAINCYEQSLVIRREFGDHRGEGRTLGNLGHVYQIQERWEEAIACYEKSLAIWHEFGDCVGAGQILGSIALLRFHQNDISQAITTARAALQVLETTQDVQSATTVRTLIQNLETLPEQA